jgi:RNA polymerase sigma factor (sigma-70 family)
LIGILTRFFGPSYLQLAEDVVQETLITALEKWSTEGTPDNPTAWLVQVAKRKALNQLKRHKFMREHQQSLIFSEADSEIIEPIYLENEIKDSQLRMIFTCCHSEIDIKSQIALTLKTLCGFGVKEVANALLTTESTINKRLYRAKEKIRQSDLPFAIPQGHELKTKLNTVGLTLYLLFNEGYNSSNGSTAIQKELCLEAVRLTKLLVDHFTENHELSALLALMCFHTARFEARIDDKGAIVLFEDQDRKLWNKELIQIGMFHFKSSIHAKQISVYHIEARIAAEHCIAKTFDATNWGAIYAQYQQLEQLKPNPIIKLNLAIIQSKLKGLETSLKELEALEQHPELKLYHLLPATQGVFSMKVEKYDQAIFFFNKALSLVPSTSEIAFIRTQINNCNKKRPTH